MANKKGAGRGWHGDSIGHARAGQKGGRARSLNVRLSKKENLETPTHPSDSDKSFQEEI